MQSENLPVESSSYGLMQQKSSEPNTDFLKYVASFLVNQATRSPATAKAYQSAILEFFRLLQSANDIYQINDIKRHHLIFYANALNQKKMANKTILKKLSAISSFCKYLAGCVFKDYITPKRVVFSEINETTCRNFINNLYKL